MGVGGCAIGWGRSGTAATCSKAFTLTVNSFVSCNASLCNSISVVRSGKAVAGVDWPEVRRANWVGANILLAVLVVPALLLPFSERLYEVEALLVVSPLFSWAA